MLSIRIERDFRMARAFLCLPLNPKGIEQVTGRFPRLCGLRVFAKKGNSFLRNESFLSILLEGFVPTLSPSI